MGMKVVVALVVVSVLAVVLVTTDLVGRLSGLFTAKGSGTLSGQLQAARDKSPRPDSLEKLPDRSGGASLEMVPAEDPGRLPELDYAAKLRGGRPPMGILNPERVEGILNPAESKRSDMAVRPEDIVGGPFGGKDFFRGGVGASEGSSMEELLKDVSVPSAGKTAGVRPAPGGGRVSPAAVRDLLSRQHASYSRTKLNTGQGSAFSHLVYGKARAADKTKGVSHETAAAAIDSVYDGRPAGGFVASRAGAPVRGERQSFAGDFGNPATASMTQRRGEASGLALARRLCDGAAARYDPLMQRLAEAMKTSASGAAAECKGWMKCEPAWPQTDEACRTWSRGKLLWDFYYRWCRCSMHKCGYSAGCSRLNRALCERNDACPLTAGKACPGMDCGI
ncbi:MAG: hypothetical protein HY748_04680 [Elusimicrobia bacterium]|nr:hypothetical protein [Elusimicrobiota bacterium]